LGEASQAAAAHLNRCTKMAAVAPSVSPKGNADASGAVKDQLKAAGLDTLDRDQFINLMMKLNPNFKDAELAQIADGAHKSAFTGSGKMCASALVDYLFDVGPLALKNGACPPAIVMGDLGSGKTSAYLFKRLDGGMIQVLELMDGDNPELPSLSGCPFEEWSAAFCRAGGAYLKEYPVIIGATQWYREMPGEQQVDLGLKLLAWGQASFPLGIRFVEVTGLKEATFEAIACRHACEAVLKVTPDLILSSGTGSMQCTCGRSGNSESISLDTKAWAKKPKEDINDYRLAAMEAMRPFETMLREERAFALLLGAAWYAIVSAGMAKSKSDPFIMSREVAIVQLTAFAVLPETAMRDAVNVWRIVDALSVMCVKEIAFGRNWKVHGENFRTTWSVGFFLDGCP